jgi:hypothetical protein
VRGQHDRGLLQVFEHPEHAPAGNGINARGRLVEELQRGVREQRQGAAELALVPPGEVLGEYGGERGEVKC